MNLGQREERSVDQLISVAALVFTDAVSLLRRFSNLSFHSNKTPVSSVTKRICPEKQEGLSQDQLSKPTGET